MAVSLATAARDHTLATFTSTCMFPIRCTRFVGTTYELFYFLSAPSVTVQASSSAVEPTPVAAPAAKAAAPKKKPAEKLAKAAKKQPVVARCVAV